MVKQAQYALDRAPNAKIKATDLPASSVGQLSAWGSHLKRPHRQSPEVADAMTDKLSLAELRNEAIPLRDAKVQEANETYDSDCADEDRLFDAVHDKAREAYEAARKRPRPTYDLSKVKRDKTLADADKELDDMIRVLYLKHEVIDSRYN
jgi:hypothetical protein